MKIKVKKKALVSVLLSLVMIMGLFFVPKVNAEDNVIDQGNMISFQAVKANLENVDVYLENNGQQGEKPISYSPGLIKDHINEIQDQTADTTFQKAVVRTYDSSGAIITENEIVRVGNYNGSTYYALTDDEDTGIGLEDNEKIVLIFSSSYSVIYNLTPQNGGSVTSQKNVYYGQSLSITIKANDNFFIKEVSYKIGNSNINEVVVSSSKEMQFAIPENVIKDNVTINVSFSQAIQYEIKRGKIISGGICQDRGNEGDRQTDTEQELNTIKPGETASFMIYSQSWSGGDKYYITKLTINGENIDVPLIYEEGASTQTTLSNGSVVTITLSKIGEGLYWKKGDCTYGPLGRFWWWDKDRNFYDVTITNVREDITLDVNFKKDSLRQVTVTGLQGIKDIRVASETAYDKSDYKFKYGLQESNSMNVYTAYHHLENASYAGQSYNIFVYSVVPGYNPYSGHVKMTYFEENGKQVIKEAYLNDEGVVIDKNGLLLERNGKPWTEVQEIRDNLKTDHRFFEYDTYNWTNDVINQGYQYGFTLTEYNSNNQILELSVDPYQYNMIFDLQGGSGLDSNKYQKTENGYIEIKDDKQVVYTLENGNVNTYMPLDTPQKDGKTFLGWRLCDSEGKVLNDKTYSENELFVINEDTIKYAAGDMHKNEGHTFTFKAVWVDTTLSEETAVYSIEVYKEDQNGTISVEGSDKKYSLDRTNNFVGIVNRKIAFLGEKNKYNPDSNLYIINDNVSKYEIAKLLDDIDSNPGWKENNVIKLYYDYQRYDLTVSKDAVGDYADLTRTWDIQVTLTNTNDSTLSTKKFEYNGKNVQLDKGVGTVSLKDGESFTFNNLIKGTQYSVEEKNFPQDYTVTYKIDNGEEVNAISNKNLSSDTTVTVINTMNDINIPDTDVPTSGAKSEMNILAIGSLGIVGIVVFMWYWRKKHV